MFQVNPCYSSEAQAQNNANAYCYENEAQEQQGQTSEQQGQAPSSEFASAFATLYSAPPQQMTTIGGSFVENQEFYQNSTGYYTIQQQQPGIMMQGQSASAQPGFANAYAVDYNTYNQEQQNQQQQQQQQQQNTDTCYMGTGGGGNDLKSDYIVSKEQLEAASLTHFYVERCTMRQAVVEEGIKEILPIVQTLLKDVEQQEPRFVYQLMGDGTDDNVSMLGRQGSEGDVCSTQPGGKFQPPTLPNGMWQRIPSVRAISTQEFQIILFLSQMAVFNCIDDGTLPGYAALKLCDGRKRSMSLWVEFITASGYLSAKKLRSRFHTLLMNAVEKQYSQAPHIVRSNQNNGSLLIYNKYVVSVVPGFRCRGCWPTTARSLSALPTGSAVLYMPSDKTGGAASNGNGGQGDGSGGQTLVGFTLIANEVFSPNAAQTNATASNSGLNSTTYSGRDSNCNIPGMDQHNQQQRRPSASADSDTWQINVFEAESNLLNATTQANNLVGGYGGEMPMSGRIACLRALKTLRDHVDGLSAVTNHQLATLVLWEWEKHPNDAEWLATSLPDRIRSILLQLINCLQNQRLDHYLLANVNILNETPANSAAVMQGMQPSHQYAQMSRKAWQLLRQLTFNFNDINRLI